MCAGWMRFAKSYAIDVTLPSQLMLDAVAEGRLAEMSFIQ